MALTTDATPHIHLTAVQVLQDEHRMKRLQVALCPGIFSYADEANATQIIDECLKICGGSAEILSTVVQTKFFVGHTPFYALIVKRHSMTGMPPLLVHLLNICGRLTLETQEDVVDASWREYDSDVYLAIRGKLIDIPTHETYSISEFFPHQEDRPVITSSGPGAQSATFRIPKFFDRIVVEGKLWLVFLIQARIWRFDATLIGGRDHAGLGKSSFSCAFTVVEIDRSPSAVPANQHASDLRAPFQLPPRNGSVQLYLSNTRSNMQQGLSLSASFSPSSATGPHILSGAPGSHHDALELYSNADDIYTSSPNRELRGTLSVHF